MKQLSLNLTYVSTQVKFRLNGVTAATKVIPLRLIELD